MTTNEVLDRWHDAVIAFRHASEGEKPQAAFRRMATEQQAIERFGVGLHIKAYRVRFPDEEPD